MTPREGTSREDPPHEDTPREDTAAEGIVRFHAEHRDEPLPAGLAGGVRALGGWRRILQRLGLLGRDPARYGGYSFGNLSVRVGGDGAFLVSGTQTSHEAEAPLTRWALVEGWDLSAERIESRGEARPSSEALTHAALYQADPATGAVFHVHAPELWRRAAELGLAATPAAVECGTGAMAVAVAALAGEGGGSARSDSPAAAGVLAMGGHADGILAFGSSPDEAGVRLLVQLARAWRRDG